MSTLVLTTVTKLQLLRLEEPKIPRLRPEWQDRVRIRFGRDARNDGVGINSEIILRIFVQKRKPLTI